MSFSIFLYFLPVVAIILVFLSIPACLFAIPVVYILNLLQKKQTNPEALFKEKSYFWSVVFITVALFGLLVFAMLKPEKLTEYDYKTITGMEMPKSAKIMRDGEQNTSPINGGLGGGDYYVEAVLTMDIKDLEDLKNHLLMDTSYQVSIASNKISIVENDTIEHEDTLISGPYSEPLYVRPNQSEIQKARGITFSKRIGENAEDYISVKIDFVKKEITMQYMDE